MREQCSVASVPRDDLTAKALLDSNPHPTEAEVRLAITGNLCVALVMTKLYGYFKTDRGLKERYS